MRDHAHSRPASMKSGITSAITTPATLHSHSTSISSFTDLSASSTNVYSSHARRVRSVRKLRQMLGPEDESLGGIERGIEQMEFSIDKELPLTPLSPSLSSSSRLSVPANNESTLSLHSPLSNIPSEDEASEKSTSLIYARRVKFEKLKRRLGEDVPKELIFFDQPPPSSHKGRSFSSPNAMNFVEHERSSCGHTKNAVSVSTIGPPSGAMMKRSRAMLRLWKPKPKSDYTNTLEAGMDGQNTDGANAHRAEGVIGGLNAEDEPLYPIQLTSLAGSKWSFSKDNYTDSNQRSFDKDTVMHSIIDENSDTEGIHGVQVVRSRNTIIVEKTNEDDEGVHFSSEVEPLRKSTFLNPANMYESPTEERQLQLGFLHPPSLGNSHDKSLSSDDSLTTRSIRKTQSAIALASGSRIQATTTHTPPLPQTSLPYSARRQEGEFSTPSMSPFTQHSSPHRSHHHGHSRGETTIWGDENLISEDDKQTGRPPRRESKPKGPRPSSRPRPRTADDDVKLRNSDEATEHWQLLEQQQKLASDRPSLESSSSSSSKSLPVYTQNSLGLSPSPTKTSSDSSQGAPPTTVVSSMPKSPQKTMAAVVYFYHRGVVRLAVEEGAKGPKTMQTVHMRDVLNYLREMRYAH